MSTTKNITSNVQTVQTVEITESQLALILGAITASTVVSLTYFVDESKSRTVKGAKLVQKRNKVNNLYLNHNYANKVNNLNGTTDFVAEEMKGKERLSSTIIASTSKANFGKLMLDGKILVTESVKNLGYFHNGEEIEINKNDNTFGRFDLMAPSFYQESTYTSGRGTVSEENDFRMITVFLSNIESIKIQGKQYAIKN